MQDLKPQRAVKSDSSWHFVGAQCDGADPLDHGQSSPVLFPRAVGVATLPVSLFGVKALRFPVGRSCKLATSRASALYRDALSLAAVLAGIGFAGRAVGWILSYSGVALIALWLIWIKGPMAIERLDLATALPSMARSVLRCSLGPRSEAVSTTRMATCHLSRPWSREVAWGRQCDCIHSAGGHIAGGVGYDLRHSTEGLPSGT